MNPKIIGAVLGVVVVAGGAFYGGTVYAKTNAGRGSGGQFAQRFVQGDGSGANGAQRGFRGPGGANGGFTGGEVISKDANSLTIKMLDGSTKIIFVGSQTQIVKSASGTLSDLSQGTQVMVTGTTNQDGSITAQSVSVRPEGSGAFGTSTRARPQ